VALADLNWHDMLTVGGCSLVVLLAIARLLIRD
jgi:hypothetical protein